MFRSITLMLFYVWMLMIIILISRLFLGMIPLPEANGQTYQPQMEYYQSTGCAPFCSQYQIDTNSAINEGIRHRNGERTMMWLHQLEMDALRQEQEEYLREMSDEMERRIYD